MTVRDSVFSGFLGGFFFVLGIVFTIIIIFLFLRSWLLSVNLKRLIIDVLL